MNKGVLLVFILGALCVYGFKNDVAYCVHHKTVWTVQEGKDGVAHGYFNYSQDYNGWNTLDIISHSSYNDSDQAYGAGFLEGALTQNSIYNSYITLYNMTMTSYKGEAALYKKVMGFANSQDGWVREMVKQNPNDFYWGHIHLVIKQMEGMLDGYNYYAPKDEQLSYDDFLFMQLNSELSDIAISVNMTSDAEISLDPARAMFKSHCSSLTKVTPDGDLYTSHVTWTTFANMLRIFKNYNLPFAMSSTSSVVVSFSGYPGYLPSGDDWYITDAHMTIAETTNGIFNMSLYKFVVPSTVPYWIRVIVANKMASSGSEWNQIFSQYNSGTYNNQYIIVDYKLFEKGQPLQADTLWIVEQIPGYVVGADQTNILSETTYWASYNIPFYPFIYDTSGYAAGLNGSSGNYFSYTKCPRAQIFKRDNHKVVDHETMKTMMRYNQWQTDPLSLGNSCNAISSRCDLNPPTNAQYLGAFGAIDAKIANSKDVQKMKTLAVAGPTWDSQPVFAWTEEWNSVPHYAQVEVFDFEWVSMQPRN